MKKWIVLLVAIALCSSPMLADVSLTDKDAVGQMFAREAAKKQGKHGRHSSGTLIAQPEATGSISLIDSSGLQYFINTDITFSTSSSASAAASEASYTAAVAASTSAGGTTMSTLNDMFDGYQTICLSFDGSTGPCQTGNASYIIYNDNGSPTTECTGRQIVFPVQTINGVDVSRKVFVPTNDEFARWINTFTNTTAAPVTFNMITSNNLGSDSNTRIVTSSSGNNAAETTDLWVTTFQNFSGSTSSDPRIGHIMQGAGAATPVSFVNFADGDDNPYWDYTITLNPGQTKTIVNFTTGQPNRPDAATKSAELALFGANATQCMSPLELQQVVNFATVEPIPALSPWALLMMGAALAFVAFFVIANRT